MITLKKTETPFKNVPHLSTSCYKVLRVREIQVFYSQVY